MSRDTGTFNFAANFEVLAKAPLDAKQLVGTKADLTGVTTWSGSSGVWIYDGAIVSVGSDPTPENNGIYFLSAATNYTDINSWVKAGTGEGGGTITGGTNGLSTSGANVVLGGTLTGTTTIDGNNNDLAITNIGDFQVKTSGDTTVLGIDETGLLFSFSGGSVTFDDGGGLKYGSTGYSSGYTPTSIPDVNFVTGLTGTYLNLDQSTPQNVTGSQPVFEEGLTLGPTPSASQISGHTVGKMYYDTDYETVSINIGTDTGHQPNIQLGQEMYRYVYNASGVAIPNGAVVQELGVHTGGPGTDVPTITMAIASGSTSDVLGVATEVFGTGVTNSYGFITTIGYIHDINTSTGSQFSGMTEGDHLYLSPTVLGGLTNIEPTTPNKAIHVGMLITKDVTVGKIYVDIHPALSLNDLLDVSVPAPTLDYVLTWNGVDWVDAAAGSTSAGSGVNFYYTTPIINAITPPAGLSEDGTAGNGIQVATLSRNPDTVSPTITVAGLDGASIRAFAAWEQDDEIGRTQIDSGLWEFYDYVGVSTVVGTTYLIHGVYQIVPVSGSTITISGASANSRTATITSGQFTGTYFNPDATNTQASYLQTEDGIFQITASASTNQVTITVPTGYVNETAVTGSTWNPLFTGSTESIETTETCLTAQLYQTKIVATSFVVSETNKLGQMMFVDSSGTYTLTLSYNGSSAASFVISPFITLHNDLPGLQGGSGEERYHITEAEAVVVGNTSGINTGDETKATIEAKLTGTISTHTHDYSIIVNTPDLSVYQSVSGFTGYTATTQQTINEIEDDITYISGVTDTKLDIDTFSGYTATTKTIFDDYTGTTQPILDAALTGATNGLYTSGRDVKLGGVLSEATTISGGSFNLCFGDVGSPLNNFAVNAALANFDVTNYTLDASNCLGIDGGDFTIVLSGSSGTISDTNSTGLKYGGDYSANYTSLSIPNVGFVTGATSSSQYYSGETPTVVCVGGIDVGYQLTGKTLSCIIQDIFVPELCGTVTAPSLGIGLTHSGIREIGCNVSQTVTGTFNQGCINPQYDSISDKRSGLPNAFCFTGTGMPAGFQACTTLIATAVNASYNVVSGSQSWGVCTRYDCGDPALGSKGTQYCAALVSGCTAASSASITGILPWYWGTNSTGTITSAIVTGGTKTVGLVATSTSITFNAVTEYLWFAAPAGCTAKTKWWVCAANAGDIGGTGELWAASCSLAVTSGQGCWSGCSFDVYITCGITTTAVGIPMCLYS